jgi:predicted outer membrane repeat protein
MFKNNTCLTSANSHSGILLILNAATLHLTRSIAMFINNFSPLSGGITIINSVLLISRSDINFSNNRGTNGGGIALYERSTIICFIGTCNLYFDHNLAVGKGGAIYTKDLDYINTYTRVLKDHALNSFGEFVLNFSYNTAKIAGDDIYGGWIDSALYRPLITIFQDNGTGTVTSNPTRICMCFDSVPECNITEYRMNIFPGETFELEAAAVGQRLGIVPSIVNVIESPNDGSLSRGQDVQSVGQNCTFLHFTVSTLRPLYQLKLRTQDAGTPELTHD